MAQYRDGADSPITDPTPRESFSTRTISPFHHFTISPFHHFTISPFHHFTISPSHHPAQ
jgi:hypothetical protein